jgi:hypothetical protein
MKKSLLISLSWLLLLNLGKAQESARLNAYSFGDGIRISDGQGGEIRITGYLQPFFESRFLLDEETDYPSTRRFRMRRLRLRVEGKSGNDRFSYRFQSDLGGTGELLDGNNNFLLDAWVAYNVARRVRVTFGQRAPYSDNRELFMNSNTLQLVERSRVTSAFAAIREFGVFIDGTFRTGGSTYLKPYLMVTNGDGPNVYFRDRGGLKYAARLDFLPFGLFTNFGQFNQVDIVRERTPKLVFGGNISYNQGMSSRRGRESGAILYLDEKNQELLPDYYKFGIDFLFKFRGFSALGEYVRGGAVVPDGITQRVRQNGTVASDFIVNGQQDVVNYITGRMMVGAAYNIQMGYLFKSGISIDGRYTYLKADEHSFLNNPTFYNRPYYYTLGVGKYLGRNYGAKIQADITYVRNNGGINDLQGQPVVGNELVFRTVATFTF